MQSFITDQIFWIYGHHGCYTTIIPRDQCTYQTHIQPQNCIFMQIALIAFSQNCHDHIGHCNDF